MVAPDRERLRRAFGLASTADAARATSAPVDERRVDGELRAFLQRRALGFRAEPAVPRTAVVLPPGEEVATAHGTFWRRTARYPGSSAHGDVRLDGAHRVGAPALRALGRLPDEAHGASDCLFLDTETTGLSGGAGTVVFAVGLAWLEGGACGSGDRGGSDGGAAEVAFEQLLLRDFGEEAALLAHVGSRLRERPLLVTYVGKSFDRHRLAARMALHRITSEVLTERHVDLYHAAARAWRKDLPDVRLRTVEERKLGFRRADDLPGSEAPAAFLDWIRDRTGPVDRVLEHNRLDVLSLVALLGVLGAGRATAGDARAADA